MVIDRKPTGPLVIGHRGASADHPENTEAAFRGAAEQGADWVELDVHLNGHGELVVHHDPRFADGRTVYDTPLAAAPDGTVDLARALDVCAPMGVNVEIKNSAEDRPTDGRAADRPLAVADAVVALLAARAEAGLVDVVLVSSFDLPTLDRVRALAPALPTGYLVVDLGPADDAPEVAAAGGHSALHPWDPFVDAALVARCRALGLAVNTWTVDDPDRVRALAALGVDGIVTNVPSSTRTALGR